MGASEVVGSSVVPESDGNPSHVDDIIVKYRNQM
jgi:hypothetical protein